VSERHRPALWRLVQLPCGLAALRTHVSLNLRRPACLAGFNYEVQNQEQTVAHQSKRQSQAA
jgi:hypothetical protein